jgi:hypothetical protein
VVNLNGIAASGDNNVTGTVFVNESPSMLVIPFTTVDDSILNLNKILEVEISLQSSEILDRNCVLLQPNVVNITITDDDGELVKMNTRSIVVINLIL